MGGLALVVVELSLASGTGKGTGKGTAKGTAKGTTLLGGPIATGNLYLTNDEANGGVGGGTPTSTF